MRKLLGALALAAAAWAQTPMPSPFLGTGGGSGGSGAANISAASAGAVTSLTLNTTALNVANTQAVLVQCWTGTTTFAPVAVTSLNPVTITGGIVTVVTPNFT